MLSFKECFIWTNPFCDKTKAKRSQFFKIIDEEETAQYVILYTHVLKRIKHAIALVKTLNEYGVNTYKAWVCDSSQQHLLHLTPRRADEVKWDKVAFVAASSDISVFKLEK